MLSGEDLTERLDGLLEGNLRSHRGQRRRSRKKARQRTYEATLDSGEDLGDGEGLRHETLDLTRTLDGELVLLGELVHAENGDDVLETLVVLEDTLDWRGAK